MNLESVRDEIKAGVTDTKEIAAIIGVGDRAVQKVRKANSSSANSETPNHSSRTTVRNEPQDASHSSEPEPQFVSEPRVCARLETPSGLVISKLVSEESPPSPSVAQPVTDWRSAFGADDQNHGVEFSQGRLTLVNGTRAFWVEQFGGDETALNLALIEAAGSIQRNSNSGLKAQVERKLANIARDTRERDKRYASAVKSKAPAAPAKATPGISAARAVLEARKAREVHA
jgi:hypothetical protein